MDIRFIFEIYQNNTISLQCWLSFIMVFNLLAMNLGLLKTKLETFLSHSRLQWTSNSVFKFIIWQGIYTYISVLLQLPYFSPECLDMDLHMVGSMSFLSGFVIATFLATTRRYFPIISDVTAVFSVDEFVTSVLSRKMGYVFIKSRENKCIKWTITDKDNTGYNLKISYKMIKGLSNPKN